MAAPISTLTRCRSGEIRLADERIDGLGLSDLIRAIVGVMGSVLGDCWWGENCSEAAAADTGIGGCRVAGIPTIDGRGSAEWAFFVLEWEPLPPPECDGDAFGMVAAVHVSVTGHSSLFTRVTPEGVVIV